MNVVEQLLWVASTGTVTLEHLPMSLRSGPGGRAPADDRRRQVADDLYDALVNRGVSFWEHVYPVFLARDITRHDVRELVRRGLQESRGRYKSLLKLFGMSSRDYQRFMNFLAAHECGVEFREFRAAAQPPGKSSRKRRAAAGIADLPMASAADSSAMA
jgi:hypothetical protein